MRATLFTLLAALLIASAQQVATQPPAAAPKTATKPGTQKKGTADPATSASGKKMFNISTTVQLVVVDVFAKDKDGNPVPNLKASDFTVTEDGKAQDIKICTYQELTNDPIKTEPATLQTRPEPKSDLPPPPAEVKSVTSNQISGSSGGEVKYKDKRLMVLFFDMTSMPIQDQIRAQDSAVKFVKTQITPSDLVAIMTFAADVKVVRDFTDDRDQLIKDIKNITVGEGTGFDATDSSDAASDTGAAFSADDSEFNIFNTDRQLSALETAAKMLGALPEKKALVYFASGLTQDKNGNNQAQLTATENAAIKANVSFYPIDARGLVASGPLGDATKGATSGQGAFTGSSQRSAQSSFQGQQETLTTLAADTGGKALLDNNDLSVGIVQAQKDISSYYIIGYYSTNGALDGHYRKIDLKIKKDLSAKLEYRHGYFAGKDFKKFDSDDKERQLSEALMLGDPITDLTVAAEIDYFRLDRQRYFIPVEVKIPGSELELAKHGSSETVRLDFIGVVKDAKGEVKSNVRDYIELKLKDQNVAELAKRAIAYDTGFILPPGPYSLKFLARDNETGMIGTYEQKFVVPDLNTTQTTLATSSVILSNQRQPVTEALYTADKDKKLLAENPLVQDNQKLIPSVTRVFKKSQDMYVYLETYEPLADTTEPVMANVSFYHGKTMAFQTEKLMITEGLDKKTKALPIRFSLPLAKLNPGRYECQVSIFNPTEKKFAITRAQIMVVP
jgi:VWFA-related protein